MDPNQKENNNNILTITSPLSSPTHEFSFTITLHPSPKNDLAPADDIFFHGHLLPLHLLPPRPSVESLPKTHPEPNTLNSTTNKTYSSSTNKSFASFFKWWRGRVKIWKKYTSFIEPLFLSKRGGRGGKKRELMRRKPHSFSGKSSAKESTGYWMRRRGGGQFSSAPVSTRTSPTNSGLLVATPSKVSSSDESSMEELQNAIKAAIAHCKNSTASEISNE